MSLFFRRWPLCGSSLLCLSRRAQVLLWLKPKPGDSASCASKETAKTPKWNALEKGQEVDNPPTVSTMRLQEMEMYSEMLIPMVSVKLSSSLEMWDCRKKGVAWEEKGVSGGTQVLLPWQWLKSEPHAAYLYKLFLLGNSAISPILPEGATATER